MPQDLIVTFLPRRRNPFPIPALFADAGHNVGQLFVDFFTAEHRNANTRAAYAQAVTRFAAWAVSHNLRLFQLMPVHVAGYVEELSGELAAPSVKQHLAAIRMLFDYLVRRGGCTHNPATAVRGPRHVVTQGRTPVLTVEEARQLFDAIARQTASRQRAAQPPNIADLRDRALIAVMVFSLARIGAALRMNIEDYHQRGKRWVSRVA